MRVLTLITVLSVCCLPVFGQSNDIGIWVSGARLGDTNDADATISFDDASGFGLSYNHFWMPSFSTEFAATPLRADGHVSALDTPLLDVGRLEMLPVTAIAQFHFARNARISPYLGAGAAYVTADDLSSSDLDAVGIGKVKIDSAFTWAANAGLNIGLTPRLGLAADAKYIAYKPDSAPADGEAIELKLNPLVYSLGVKFRW